jgi:peroxiredoxin
MRSDIVPGATFPDYELPDHENNPRKLSGIQGDDPMILTLARGHYCPKASNASSQRSCPYDRLATEH